MNAFKKSFSLKKRIFIFFFGVLLLMICTYIMVISRFITRFTQERLNTEYESILTETCDTIGNILWNLTLTSQQLLDNEEIISALENHFSVSGSLDRKENYNELLNTIYSLTMANTELGLLYFYDIDSKEYIYSSIPVERNNDEQHALYQTSGFRFQGPCKSQSNYNANPVMALTRTETLPSGRAIKLSIESGYYSLEKPFAAAEQKMAYLIFTSETGQIICNTIPEVENITQLISQLQNGSRKDFRYLSKKPAQGWTAHIIIPNSVYTRDYQLALRDFISCTLLVTVLVGCFALYFWRSVYHPLQLFDRQLSSLLSEEDEMAQMHSSIPEYDYLLQKITALQKQIQDMIHWKITQEKLHSQMQLEKLRAQINPHFLMNTLNTLHWLALMNKQPDIDKITQALSHLLAYNLDKQSYETNLENEIMALKEYITLQQTRYTFDFYIHSEEPLENLNYPCPKFILQPLAENSLSHGYREGMAISLTVCVKKDIEIILHDTGTGINPNTLQKLQNLSPLSGETPSDNTFGLHSGIGLAYVVQILNDFYTGNYDFKVTSIEGQDTTVTIIIPKLKGGGYYAENTDY